MDSVIYACWYSGLRGLTNNIQNIPWLFKTFLMPILDHLCNFTAVIIPPKAKKMQMLARSDISAEAFSCHLILGTQLEWGAHSHCALSATVPAAATQPTAHKSLSSILLLLSVLKPKCLCFYGNCCYYSPFLSCWRLAITPCPSGCNDHVNLSVTTEDASTHPYKAWGPSFAKMSYMRDTTSWNICQPLLYPLAAAVALLGAHWALLPSGRTASEVCWKLLSAVQVSADSHSDSFAR